MIGNNLVGMLFIPVVIGLIDPIRYGIWLTVNSVLQWFNLFDIGLGGGLRTRLAQALASEDHVLARRYISTGYAFLISVVASASLVFVILKRFINWAKIFNAPLDYTAELSAMMLFVVLFFLVRFVLQLLSSVLVAFQMTFISSLVNFVAHLGSLLVIFVLFHFIDASLFLIGFIYSLTPMVVILVVSIVFYYGRLKNYRPAIRFIDAKCLKPIMNLGIFEFIDRVSFIIISSATNLLISHIGTPADVVPYNVTMRLLGFFLTGYNIVTEPITPAFTEAYTKNDEIWVKRVIRKTNMVSIIGVFTIMLMIPVAKPLLEILVKNKVTVPYSVIILVAILISNRLLSVVFGKFLTGIGKPRLIVSTSAVCALIYLPLVRFFSVDLALGILSVVAAQILVEAPLALVKYIQTRKIITHTATGIWNN